MASCRHILSPSKPFGVSLCAWSFYRVELISNGRSIDSSHWMNVALVICWALMTALHRITHKAWYAAFRCKFWLIFCQACGVFRVFQLCLIHQTKSYLDIRVRFYVTGKLYNFHLLAIPLFQRHTAETMFDVSVKFLDALCPMEPASNRSFVWRRLHHDRRNQTWRHPIWTSSSRRHYSHLVRFVSIGFGYATSVCCCLGQSISDQFDRCNWLFTSPTKNNYGNAINVSKSTKYKMAINVSDHKVVRKSSCTSATIFVRKAISMQPVQYLVGYFCLLSMQLLNRPWLYSLLFKG